MEMANMWKMASVAVFLEKRRQKLDLAGNVVARGEKNKMQKRDREEKSAQENFALLSDCKVSLGKLVVVVGWRRTGESAGVDGQLRSTDIPSKSATRCARGEGGGGGAGLLLQSKQVRIRLQDKIQRETSAAAARVGL